MRSISHAGITIFAAAALAWPTPASAQAIGHCQELVDPVWLVCASVEITSSHVGVVVTTNADTKYIVSLTGEGLRVCVYTASTRDCIVEPR